MIILEFETLLGRKKLYCMNIFFKYMHVILDLNNIYNKKNYWTKTDFLKASLLSVKEHTFKNKYQVAIFCCFS